MARSPHRALSTLFIPAVLAAVRPVVFWAHLACGLAVGLVVLVMSVTGVALTYQRQLQYWADTSDFRTHPLPGVERAPVAALLIAANQVDPATAPTTISYRADPTLPAAVALGPRTIYLNPYTAEVYGEGRGQRMRAFFGTMTSWHRYLGRTGDGRGSGRAVTGASNLVFLFLVLSGLYLWWPPTLRWARVRQVVWFRRGLPPKARDFNWHNAIGFWSALPLAIVVYSGVVISYPWASNMVYRVVGEAPPPTPTGGRGAQAGAPGRGDARGHSAGPVAEATAIDLDAVISRVQEGTEGWRILTARVPVASATTVSLTVDRGDGGQPQARATVSVDSATGAVASVDDFAGQSPGRRLRSLLRFAHTGEVLGLPGQTVAGLVSAGAAVLVYTGLSLSARRLGGWWRRRPSRRPDQTAAVVARPPGA